MRLFKTIVCEAAIALLELLWLAALGAICVGGTLVIVNKFQSAYVTIIGSFRVDRISAIGFPLVSSLLLGMILGGFMGGEFRRKRGRAEMGVVSLLAAVLGLTTSLTIVLWRDSLGWLLLLILLIITCFLSSFALALFGQGETKKAQEPRKPEAQPYEGWVGTITG